MSATRTTFGFSRTECACAECVLNCRIIPGYLIPTDLTAMAAELGYENLLTFAQANLLASPGATVMANGALFQIPTLVPARQANGACQFLTVTSPKRWREMEAKAGAGATETLPFTRWTASRGEALFDVRENMAAKDGVQEKTVVRRCLPPAATAQNLQGWCGAAF